ncbi:MAG: hypothetical protein M3Z75_30670, partial [Actinomycetota bacterium]|nr:hypothetical protein [Actinomycetota bacterium]
MFSNGIILLAVLSLSLSLSLVAGATVDALIPFYAIGVFTGFAMAGFGMARYHRRTRERGWRRRLVINTAGGIYTALVVVLFAVVKFTEGAWLIVIGVAGLQPHPPNYSRRVVLLLVDSYDLATIAGSGTPRAYGRRCCARCISAWTVPGRTSSGGNGWRPGPEPRWSWRTARTGGWPTPRPGWPPA